MSQRRTVASALFAVVLGTCFVHPVPVTAASETGQDRALRIWASGDSFAAGEGLRGIQVGEEQCQRALGFDAGEHNPPSKAWPVLVKGAFENGSIPKFDASRSDTWTVDEFWFTACTGATSETLDSVPTNRGTTQLQEIATAGESATFDVAMTSFGGNDIGFADVIRDCIGFDWDAVEADAVMWYATVGVPATVSSGAGAGCSTGEEELKARIQSDLVTNGRLEHLYDTIASKMSDGGLVVVTGYPQLFTAPERWSNAEKLLNRCHRVSEGDVRALRGATGALNQTLGEAVTQASERHPQLTWVFVDVSATFESGQVFGGLCGNLDAVNGFAWNSTRNGQGDSSPTSGFARSYHPNQNGHNLYAFAVVRSILASGWTPHDIRPVQSESVGECTDEYFRLLGAAEGAVLDESADYALSFTGYVCSGDWAMVYWSNEDIPDMMSEWLVRLSTDEVWLLPGAYFTPVGVLACLGVPESDARVVGDAFMETPYECDQESLDSL